MTENYFNWLPSRQAELDAGKKFTTVADAVLRGTADDVKAMIASGADVNASKFGATPLLIAVEDKSELAVVKALLDGGADVTATNGDGETALDLAIENDVDKSVIEVLTRAVEAMKPKFDNLFDAVVKGTADDVAKLIKNGAIVNEHKLGVTPLMLAARFGTAEMMQILLSAGARLLEKDDAGRTVLDYARENDPKIAKLLEKERAKYVTRFDDICDAAWHGNVWDIKALVKKGADLEKRKKVEGRQLCRGRHIVNNFDTEMLPLMLALRFNPSDKVFKALLEAGANVNARNNKGSTPLIQAVCVTQPIETIKTLLKAGADVNARDNNNGATPLLRALSVNQSIEIIEMLLKAGADVNARDSNGWTPLFLVRSLDVDDEAKKAEIIRILQAAGAR